MALGAIRGQGHTARHPWISGVGSTALIRWPSLVFLAFASYPLWWALGLGYFFWPIVTLPMAFALSRISPVRTPPRFGLWLLFLLWMLLSSVELTRPISVVLFAYRTSIYVSATILCLYIYNIPWRTRQRDLTRLLALAWVALAVGGLLGAAFPHLAFASPVSVSIPATYYANQWVRYMVHPAFAEIMHPFGYAIGRPKLFFAYTNQWGGCLGLLTPAAVAHARRGWNHHRALIFTLAAISLVPIVISLDRGLWIGLLVGLGYLAVRSNWLSRGAAVSGVASVVIIVLGALLLTPLGAIVSERLSSPSNSNNTRSTVYAQTVDELRQSPIFGYGTPRVSASAHDSTLPAIGTQSQYGLVGYSHGIIALILFAGWFAATWLRTRKSVTFDALCLNAVILVGLVEMVYYDFMPTSLHVLMLAAAGLWAGADALDGAEESHGANSPSGVRRFMPRPAPADRLADDLQLRGRRRRRQG